MKTMTFTYNKDATHQSERVFIPLVAPTDKYFGIDVSELDEENQSCIAIELESLANKYKRDQEAIMAGYDVKHNYRSFFPSKMTNIVHLED